MMTSSVKESLVGQPAERTGLYVESLKLPPSKIKVEKRRNGCNYYFHLPNHLVTSGVLNVQTKYVFELRILGYEVNEIKQDEVKHG